MKIRSTSEHPYARLFFWLVCLAAWSTNLLVAAAQQPASNATGATTTKDDSGQTTAGKFKVATFGGGCFWCVESVFENVNGVVDVVSGYAGGRVPNPSYEMVKTGQTGHAEVCEITYDSAKVTYLQLLEIFLKTHDPTSKNRQGPDHGTQYRSVILYHDDEQKQQAQELIEQLDGEKVFRRKIVTTLEPYTLFFPAEAYHQDYFRKNPNDAYCTTYTRPKLAKLRKVVKEMEAKKAEPADKK